VSAFAKMVVLGSTAAEEADLLMDALAQDMAAAVAHIGGGASQLAPVYTGQLRRLLNQTGVERIGDTGLDGWIAVPGYWEDTEFGTGPKNVPVGDGTPGSGLLHWVRVKKLAVVKVAAGKHAGKFIRRGAGVDRRSGSEGSLGSVGVYGEGDALRPVSHSRAKVLVTAIEKSERSAAYAIQWSIRVHGVREQAWFRRSNPQVHVSAFERSVARRLGGDLR